MPQTWEMRAVPLGNGLGRDCIRAGQSHRTAKSRRPLTHYTRSLGELRPQAVSNLFMIVRGADSVSGQPVAYERHADSSAGEGIRYRPESLDLSLGTVEFRGSADAVARATELWSRREPGISARSDVMSVLRTVAKDDNIPSVGGGLQLGYTHGLHFRRVAHAVPLVPEETDATIRLNNVDVFALGTFGEWPVFSPTIA